MRHNRRAMHTPPIVPPDEWNPTCQQKLVKEKAHARTAGAFAGALDQAAWHLTDGCQ